MCCLCAHAEVVPSFHGVDLAQLPSVLCPAVLSWLCL